MTALPTSALPQHVAIIMDGNGRWAKRRYLPRQAGHVAGVAAVREVVRAACDLGIAHLTLYAFSSENWKRPLMEVNHLMGLFRAYFKSDVDELCERNVRMRIIGNRSRAARELARAAMEGKLDPDSITPDLFADQLLTKGLPAPDLIIRTSGERRMSNFLLWQSAYAELLFVDTLWPDFRREEFLAALDGFAQRDRRFGAVASDVA